MVDNQIMPVYSKPYHYCQLFKEEKTLTTKEKTEIINENGRTKRKEETKRKRQTEPAKKRQAGKRTKRRKAVQPINKQIMLSKQTDD